MHLPKRSALNKCPACRLSQCTLYCVAKYTQLHLKASRVLNDLRTKTTQDRSVELRKPVLVSMSFPHFSWAMLPIAQTPHVTRNANEREREIDSKIEKEDKQVTEENPIFDTSFKSSQTHDFHSTQTSFWISPETQHMHLQQANLSFCFHFLDLISKPIFVRERNDFARVTD